MTLLTRNLVVIVVLILLNACGSAPIRIQSTQLSTDNPTKLDDDPVVNAGCKVAWGGLTDIRSNRDPIGYMLAKPIYFPELATVIDKRLGSAFNQQPEGDHSTATLHLSGELVRAFIEQHLDLITFNVSIRIKQTDSGSDGFLTSAHAKKTVIWGSDAEAMQFVDSGVRDVVQEVRQQILSNCSAFGNSRLSPKQD